MAAVQCEVIGRREIAGVAKGGKVALDPERVNIDALVKAGHVRVVKKTAGQQQSGDES